jgi:hypothetical protein
LPSHTKVATGEKQKNTHNPKQQQFIGKPHPQHFNKKTSDAYRFIEIAETNSKFHTTVRIEQELRERCGGTHGLGDALRVPLHGVLAE